MGDRLGPSNRSLLSMNSANPRPPNLRKRPPTKPPETNTSRRRSVNRTARKGDDPWYNVRDILDEKAQASGLLYLIDWEGTDPHGRPWKPTWEKAEDVTVAAISAWEDKKNKLASTSRESSASSTGSSTQDSQPVRAPARRRDLKRGSGRIASEGGPAQAPGPHEEERVQKRRRTDDHSTIVKNPPGSADTKLGASTRKIETGKIDGGLRGSTGIQGGRIVVELPQNTGFNPSEFNVVSLSQTASQRSSQSTAVQRIDERVIPDSQEISATSASEAHNSQDFPLSSTHSQATNRTSPKRTSKNSAAPGSTSEIPSHQPDPFLALTSRNWANSTFLTDSRTTTTTNRLNQSHLQPQPTTGAQDPVFATQVSFGSDTEPGESQGTRVSTVQRPESQNSQDLLSAKTVSSQGTHQAAQIVLPPNSQLHELSQSQENFTVYDEVSNSPNTASRQTQTTQDSQDSSQALSELDGNTRTSSAPRDPEARLLAPPVLGEQDRDGSTALGNLPPGPHHPPRDSVAERLTTPNKMDGAPAEDAPLSARESLRLLRERNFGPDESSLSSVAHPNPGPLVSPTFVIPSLEPEQGGQHSPEHPSAFEAPQAPIETAHGGHLVLETGTSQLPYHGPHEEQPATLNPSQLTLSIEGDMDVSPSIPTDDGIGGSYAVPGALVHDDTDVQSDYPKSLLPYVPTGPNEYLVTLPFHTNIRPQYNDILRENEALIHKYNASFRVSPHQTPEATTVLKLDEMFSRLFDICDFPPFLDSISSLSPDMIAKHAIGTNAKFSFIAEVLDILNDMGSDKKILVLVRPGQLMDLLGIVIQSRGCRYIRSGGLVADSSSHNDLTVELLSTTDSPSLIPKDVDAIIAFDHTFQQGVLPSFDDARPPIILALTNTASIQHLNMRIVDNLEPLERKNVLMLALVKAMRYVEDPDHPVKLSDSADLFAKFIQLLDEDDDFHWEAQELPDDIFEDLYAASSQTQPSQSSMLGYGADQLLDTRKRFHMGGDDDVLHKRPKMSQMSQPQVITDTSQISDSLKSLIRDECPKDSGQATVTVSIEMLETLSNQIADLQTKLDESKRREIEFRELSDRSKREVDGYALSVREMQAKFMDALKDRGVFEADWRSAKDEAQILARNLESSQAANAKLKEKNVELEKKLSEATNSLLAVENPDVVKLVRLEKELDEAKVKTQQLEKRTIVVQKDMEYAKDQYQNASQRAMELSTENRGLEQQVASLRHRADANIVEINRIQSRREAKELSRLLAEQRAIVRDREAELSRVKEEIKSLRNSRRETRQSSVPRSPRLSALGVMSPRNGGGVRVPSAMGGGSSRGTSPAPMFEGVTGGGPGAGGNVAANLPLFGQPAGNNRYAHLRDGRF